ncbi:hypothetical protein C5167_004332, partial [Papaver somniferum]
GQKDEVWILKKQIPEIFSGAVKIEEITIDYSSEKKNWDHNVNGNNETVDGDEEIRIPEKGMIFDDDENT